MLAVLFIAKGPQATAAVAGIMGVMLGLPALAIALRGWARQGTQATADQVGQARESLAGWVIDQWRDEALMRSLGDPKPMPIQWRLADQTAGGRPWLLVSNDLAFTGRSDRIDLLVEKFRRLQQRRLVILGRPGSGKTTLAVQLLLELLATRGTGEPIPVLLSLAGWNPTAHPLLHGWLAERLVESYPSLRAFGPNVACALAEQGHILPILDGLDELPSTRQPHVITALNASLTEADQFVLTSRTQEYATAIVQAHRMLTGVTVIEPEPLTPSQAANYLAACLPSEPHSSWRDVLDRLHAATEEHLARVLTTPLGLWLLRTVYVTSSIDPRPLLNSEVARDATTLQAYLFDQLIPAVLSTRPTSRNAHAAFRPQRDWNPTKVSAWLSYLAQHLHRTETRDLLWWHLARYTFTRRIFGLGIGLMIGLEFGLAVGLVFGLVVGLTFGLTFGLMFGLVAGLLAGLRIGLRGHNWLTDEPAYVNLRLKHRTRMLGCNLGVGLAAGLGIGLVFGLVDRVVDWLVFGQVVKLADWLVFGLAGIVFGLGGGLIKWVGTLSRDGWASTPNSTYTATRVLTLIQICVVGLGGGLGAGLLAWLVEGQKLGLGHGLVLGLMGGSGLGLVFLSSGAWLSYLLTSCRLAAAGKLPLRLMVFLDDAHRLGLLRMTGPAYQFRHAEFHDHLITLASETETDRKDGIRFEPPRLKL